MSRSKADDASLPRRPALQVAKPQPDDDKQEPESPGTEWTRVWAEALSPTGLKVAKRNKRLVKMTPTGHHMHAESVAWLEKHHKAVKNKFEKRERAKRAAAITRQPQCSADSILQRRGSRREKTAAPGVAAPAKRAAAPAASRHASR